MKSQDQRNSLPNTNISSGIANLDEKRKLDKYHKNLDKIKNSLTLKDQI